MNFIATYIIYEGEERTMKKMISLLFAFTLMITLVACGNADNNQSEPYEEDAIATETNGEDTATNDEDADMESDESELGDGYYKFSQLEMGMTESDVYAILGEPIRVDKAQHFYNVTVNGTDLELEVWINTVTGLVTYFRGNFTHGDYRAVFADGNVDFSRINELENGEINSYEEAVEAFNSPGYLMSAHEDGRKTYFWVNDVDGYLRINFSSDGSVSGFSGFL